ncbi:hypothetical protein BC826DRAFT_1004594 [Russula brevipes]|nr:hypothetical protein BC826DRAFT_1004594 [Russula brevipes]
MVSHILTVPLESSSSGRLPHSSRGRKGASVVIPQRNIKNVREPSPLGGNIWGDSICDQILNPFLCAGPSFSYLHIILPPLFTMPCFPANHPRFLEPLEEFPLVVPFPEAHLLSSEPGALGLFNETPSTIDMSLPTPSIPVFAMFNDELQSPAQVHYDTSIPQSETIQPPPAPLIKDMDSFSEGTAQGSFDFTLCSDHDDGQAPPSVAFSPDHPTLSIEIWRDDVVRSAAIGWEERHPRTEEDGLLFGVRSLFFIICGHL